MTTTNGHTTYTYIGIAGDAARRMVARRVGEDL